MWCSGPTFLLCLPLGRRQIVNSDGKSIVRLECPLKFGLSAYFALYAVLDIN